MPGAVIKQLSVGPMMNFAYLICDPKEKLCAAVDPGWESDKIAAAAKADGMKIEKILLTHAHFDHAQDLSKLIELTGAALFVHESEMDEVPKGIRATATRDGTSIHLGGLDIKCIHTPGHTPGSQCFLVDGALLTGDTLFVDGCGRVDLPGSDPGKMLLSLKNLAKLPPEMVIYPGHDYGPSPTATIGEQIKNNPYMSARSESVLL